MGGPRQRAILAMLALAPGRVVPVDALVEAVWQGRPPATARTQVAICVAGLRKTFKEHGVDEEVISTSPPGYLLRAEGHRVDAVEFAEAVESATTAAAAGEVAEAAWRLDTALKLWRGAALAGISGHAVEIEAARLEEQRLTAYEQQAALRLELGQHRDLVGELSTLVREHPLREQARAQLMLAQYRSGLRAEALSTFLEGRRLSIEEFGLELGPVLREMHAAILRDDPALTRQPRARAVVPAQLPGEVYGFTGREPEVRALDRLLDAAPGTPTTALITGGTGLGKTGLAVHWARRAAGHYPDGQLFADLDSPVAEVLSGFLRALGVPEDRVPAETAERSALLRSTLKGRKVLLVLDNASSFEQISPLLPGSSGCCVLVTSRVQLYGLLGQHHALHLRLDRLAEPDAVRLLGAVAGPARVAADPGHARRLARLCDRTPLALRIAGARLAAKPHWTVRHLADRLTEDSRRLDELSTGELDLRAGFAASCRALTEAESVLLRRLSLLAVPDVSAWVGAALLDTGLTRAEKLMERLVDRQLLQVVGTYARGGVRYRVPELLRLYAKELCERHDSEAEREAACARAYSGWLALALAALHRERLPEVGWSPEPEQLAELVRDPQLWFELERVPIFSVIHQAELAGLAPIAEALAAVALPQFVGDVPEQPAPARDRRTGLITTGAR
ncbi:DNA-binding SARP family transcriptional activator [Kutzneria viridogrisea]|uniref:DNA-binding SARP family transcriptional activator n=1 Tax=Kutzneria viridogrisea TaxID=47990 RepID=A0ABR6B7T8_9PSEU|nr:AfsR/SARP family transcriptional regulator [Kutzneria albida]MBA8922939.1 DNA-binding SARP family transcriptional activator [Kutzneria viridogrisea]